MSHDRKQQQASTAGADRLRAGSRPIALALLPLLFIGASQPAIAADVTWDAGTGDWVVGSNWVGGSAPAPADKAIIENGGTAQIGAGDSPSIDYFDIGAQENTSGTLDILGGGELTVSGFMRVGNGAVSNGIGTLNVGAGSTLTRTGLFAFEVSGNGSTVNVSGADALWTGGVDNGVWGGGALNVDNGGRVDVSGLVANSGGEINITGAGTTVSTTSMYVGNFGAGTLTVADAAELSIAGGAEHFFLGVNHAAADGTLNIGTGGPAGILNVPAIEYGWGTARINFNHSDDISFGIPIGLRAGYNPPGTLSLSKQGTGTLDLTGDYGYTGDTTVSGGTLLVNGSITNSSTTVNSGGTLGGEGLIRSVTVVGGTIAPGNSPGTLTIAGNLVLDSASILEFELGAPNQPWDLIEVTDEGGDDADVTLDGMLHVIDLGGFGVGSYYLIYYDGILTDQGLDLVLPAGFEGSIDTASEDGAVILNVMASGVAIPTLSEWAMLALGGLLLLFGASRLRMTGRTAA